MPRLVVYLFYMVSLIYYRTKHVYQERASEHRSTGSGAFAWFLQPLSCPQAVKRGEFFEIGGIRVPRLACSERSQFCQHGGN